MELLVALAVTAVLIGMLVPVVWAWRQEEERAAQVAALVAEANGFFAFAVSELRRARAAVRRKSTWTCTPTTGSKSPTGWTRGASCAR